MPIVDMSNMPAQLAQQIEERTGDLNWQTQREQIWDKHHAKWFYFLKRSELKALKRCFLTGEIDSKLVAHRHFDVLIDLFPIVEPASIGYLIETLYPILEQNEPETSHDLPIESYLVKLVQWLIESEFSSCPERAISYLHQAEKLSIFDWILGENYSPAHQIEHRLNPEHPGWQLDISIDDLLLRLLLRLMPELDNNCDLNTSVLWQRPNYLASLIAALPDSCLTANWEKDEDKQDKKTYLWIALAMGISSATASLSPRLQALKDKQSQLVTAVTKIAEQRPLLKQLLSDLQAPSAFFKPILEYAEDCKIQIGLDEANLKIWQQHFNKLEPREGESRANWGFVDLRVAPDDPDNPDLVFSLLAKIAPHLSEQWLAIRALNIYVAISLLQKPYYKNYALLIKGNTRKSNTCNTKQAEQALVALFEQLPITSLESWIHHESTFIENRS
ncbi:hypothetical protein AHAT_17220 [Agarivorans sp. Toyoura001]|uniref:hypothetical protein n=1 Tax=Agarivorans sp. Toyoura001 TaxID=2283141 RepID=UPI0010EAD644|nr:hypothetical protein [Agarivorans sp. Toyoura001]GDY25832.1 hypothetical protein AHAT_17220 [Agarivorans sp. Toyoura001]